jgi:histidinol-phosphate aminotransferase
MTGPVPKSSILGIHPYKPGKAKAAGFDKPIKLSANENALGPSPRAVAAYREAAERAHLYPDPRANDLREAIAKKYGLDPMRLLFGTGSDEIFSMACQAYLSRGDTMAQPQYAFAAWAIAARASGAEVISAPEKNYTVDVDAMLAAVKPNTRIVFIANPANPTGTAVPLADIKRFHAALPENVLFVLDGAYMEFADEDGDAAFKMFGDAPNVIISRTFSKLYGLAALRVGWAYGPSSIMDVLNLIRLPFNVSVPAQAAAVAALEDEAFAQASIAHAKRGRAALTAHLSALGLAPLPSATNFVTFRVPSGAKNTAQQIEAGLAAKGVLIRGLENYGMADCLRVTVGTDDEMRAFEDGLRSLL